MVLALSLLAICGAATAADSATYGMFTLTTDPSNAYLPSSLRLTAVPEIEFLHPKLGLNLGFRTYEFRSKFYLEENRYFWENLEDPRFVSDVPQTIAAPVAATEGDFSGESVSYASSYAQIERSLLFHKAQAMMRIVYNITANRDIMIHMPCMFKVGLRFDEAFSQSEILDERNPTGPPLAFAGNKVDLALLNMGPVAIGNQDGTLSLLVSHTVSGDLSTPLPFRLIKVKNGQRIVVTVEIECFRGERERVLKKMRALHAGLDPAAQACRLYATGYHVLYREKKEAEGEALLLQAAAAAPEWYLPYMMIAEYCPQQKNKGVVRGTTRGQNYYEAAFRMPWHCGTIMRGSDYLTDARLSETQQRLLLFNLMCSMENILFYPDSYAQLARPFEKRKMYAQACAIYRQALWAVDYFPVKEETRAKTRAGFLEKINALEKKLLTDITADPSRPIAVRPAGE